MFTIAHYYGNWNGIAAAAGATATQRNICQWMLSASSAYVAAILNSKDYSLGSCFSLSFSLFVFLSISHSLSLSLSLFIYIYIYICIKRERLFLLCIKPYLHKQMTILTLLGTRKHTGEDIDKLWWRCLGVTLTIANRSHHLMRASQNILLASDAWFISNLT